MQHKGVVYNCDQCSYKGKLKGQVKEKNKAMQHEGFIITTTNVVINLTRKVSLKDIKKWINNMHL